jgi:hypothetical protein
VKRNGVQQGGQQAGFDLRARREVLARRCSSSPLKLLPIAAASIPTRQLRFPIVFKSHRKRRERD